MPVLFSMLRTPCNLRSSRRRFREKIGAFGRASGGFSRIIGALGAMAIVAHLGGAVVAEEPWTIRRIVEMRTVSAAKISPDGKLIAYTISTPRTLGEDENGPPWGELHVADANGTSRPFVTGEVNVGSIEWTPDGGGISFLAKRGKDKHHALYVIPVNGGEARKVVSHETAVGGYAWSPDGARVAFLAEPKKPKEMKELEEKGFNQEIHEEDWRPARVWIATVGDETAKPRELELEGSASELRWSPDGKHLALALAPTPSVDDEQMERRIRIVDVDSGQITQKINNPGKLGQIAWSPDGKRLAYISAEDRSDPLEGRLMVWSLAQQKSEQLVPNYEGHVAAIAWQDADTVMFIGDEGVYTTFSKIDFDGAQRKTIVPAGGPILRSFSLSADGQSSAFVADSPTNPAEVYFMKHGDEAPKRVSNTNPWLAGMPYAKQEAVEHTARDGLKLHGILVRPLNEEPGKRYPLIVAVHGGPEAHVSNGWVTRYINPAQFWAANGYAVFYPNYRGSTGRGVAFSKADQRDYAGREFDDLVDAVEHLVASGLVDRAKVGVTGGSYGGYATAWCATRLTEHFAAGVMFVGISNLVSKVGTTDIPNEMHDVHARVWPWEDWAFFHDRSPITHAQQSRTPLLILHGKDDPRVHPSQSLELYRYLKLHGKTVRLVWYPGEGHGNRKVAAQYDYCLRMTQWFDHYLKGPGGAPPALELDYGLSKEEKEEGGNGASNG